MIRYISGGVIWQSVILEVDEEGRVRSEHVMPPVKSLWPYEEIEETVRRQVREFSKPAGEIEERR